MSININRWVYTSEDEGGVEYTFEMIPQDEQYYTFEGEDGKPTHVVFLTTREDGIQHEVCVGVELLKALMQHITHEEIVHNVTRGVITPSSDVV